MHLDRQSLWRDEVDAIRFSSWSIDELIAGLFRTGHNGPLFFLLLRPWRSLAGNSEFALRYPSALLSTLAIPLGFTLARQLGFSRRAGLLLGLLLATSPYLIWYGQEAKMYALLLALVSLAFIAYLKARAGAGPGWWAAFVIATTISFYVHILSPLMLIVYSIVALLYPRQWRRYWRGWLVSMACLTVPYVPLALWQLPLLLRGFYSGHPFYSLKEQTFTLLQLYSSGLVRFAGPLAVLLVVFLVLCGLFLSEKRRGLIVTSSGHKLKLNPARRTVLAAWVLLPPLVVYLISLRVQVFEDRYLIYIAPAFYLLVAAGLLLVRQHTRVVAAFCLGALLVINLVGIWQQQYRPLKADFRAVAAYLSEQPVPPTHIMVQMPYLQHTLNYYYSADYILLEGLWTNDGKNEATVDREMASLTASLTELWLVVSEEDMWDSRHLTRAWLDKHAYLVKEVNYVRVSVYHYQLKPGAITEGY
jgi:uncharacterized membrane protein